MARKTTTKKTKTTKNKKGEKMKSEEIIELLEQIRDYLTSGNPIWDTETIAEGMDAAIEAFKAKDNPIICPRCGRTFAEADGRDKETPKPVQRDCISKQIKELLDTSKNMHDRGYYAWGNKLIDAADTIEALSAKLKAQDFRFDLDEWETKEHWGSGYIFEELIVEDMGGKPYYSIRYKENGVGHIGYSSYKLSVISKYLKEYFGMRAGLTHGNAHPTHACVNSTHLTHGAESDLVSRQAVLNEVKKIAQTEDEYGNNMLDRLDVEYVICHIAPAVEFVGDLISRQAAISAVCANCLRTDTEVLDGCLGRDCSVKPALESLPSACCRCRQVKKCMNNLL